MEEPTRQSINQHTQKTSLDWLFNILVQPSTGTGSGVAPAVHEQFGLSLDLLRQALVEVTNVVNNITTTVPGKVLDARQGNALRILINSVADGVLWQEEILSIVSTPPSSPTDEDRYIVGQSATGAWSGHDGEIATWDATGSAWTFETPAERWGVFNHATTELLYYHVGAWLVLGDLGQITTILNEAEAARDQILNDPGFQAVAADLLGDDEIGVVAAALGIISAVNDNSTNITAVAGNSTNINAVAGNEAKINTVADDLLLGTASLIKKVADSIANVNLVGGSITNVNAVAADLAIITAVYNNASNITNVAGNEVNINKVAGISVAVTTVAGKSTEVQALADRAAKIDALYAKIAEMEALYGRTTEIDALYARTTELDALGARTTEIDALYAELDQIAVKENASNKKTTLADNSDTYFPTQKAVNLGLNKTMAEIMGSAPRNLMDVFGTSTVADTFTALRDYCDQNHPTLPYTHLDGFRKLRLGDYIDLDSFTVNNWYNNAPYDSATGAWDTTVTVTKNLSYENTRVEIVGFDDYYYVGNTAIPSAHHVTMMFKNLPLSAPMHKLNTSPYYQTSQGYTGSDLITIGLANWYTAIESQFGTATPRSVDRIIATVDGYEWCGAEKLFLPTGMNIFGSPGFARADRGVGTQHLFPLYALNPNKSRKRYNGASRSTWWLAEPSAGSSSLFTLVNYYGTLDNYTSYNSLGVAPAFLI